MAAIALSSIGVKVSYAVEETAGTRPVTGYKHIVGLKSVPAFNVAPETYETTTLDNTEFTTYINGLKDLGGALEMTANYSQTFLDLWNGTSDTTGLMGEYKTAKADGKATWLCVDVPDITKSTYFTVEPSKLGIPEITLRSVLEITAYITPTGEPIDDVDPTYAV